MTPTSKRIALSGATIKKHGRKLMGSNMQGSLALEHTRGTMVVKVDISYLNEEFLGSLRQGESIDVEISIKKLGAQAPISQPHLPVR